MRGVVRVRSLCVSVWWVRLSTTRWGISGRWVCERVYVRPVISWISTYVYVVAVWPTHTCTCAHVSVCTTRHGHLGITGCAGSFPLSKSYLSTESRTFRGTKDSETFSLSVHRSLSGNRLLSPRPLTCLSEHVCVGTRGPTPVTTRSAQEVVTPVAEVSSRRFGPRQESPRPVVSGEWT